MMTVKIYRDKAKEFRWRLVAKNGKVIADSAEGYTRKSSMMKTVMKMLRYAYFDLVDTTE